MIKSWVNRATEKFSENGKGKFSGLDEDAALDLLASLDAATSLSDLSPLKSVDLRKLKGDRKAQWAMTINGPWRLCFRFEDCDGWEVETLDYQ